MASNFFFQKSNFEKKALKIFFFNEKSLQKLFFNVTIYVTELQMKYQGLNLRFQGFIAFKLWRVQNVGKKYPKKATVFLVTSSAISYEPIIFPCSINLDLYRKIIILTTGLIVYPWKLLPFFGQKSQEIRYSENGDISARGPKIKKTRTLSFLEL